MKPYTQKEHTKILKSIGLTKMTNSNASKDKATPRPWAIEKVKGFDKKLVYCKINGANVYKSSVAGTDEANAELIVRAVNAHQDLVEALKMLVRRYDFQDDDQAQAEQAIAKAEGK